MHVSRHDHFSLYVSDLARSTQWYQDVLGLEPRHVDIWWSEAGHFLGSGDALVALFARPAAEDYSSRQMPIGNHQAFRVSRSDFEGFKTKLDSLNISYREVDHTISHSIYFQDPDDYWIELTTYDVTRGT